MAPPVSHVQPNESGSGYGASIADRCLVTPSLSRLQLQPVQPLGPHLSPQGFS